MKLPVTIGILVSAALYGGVAEAEGRNSCSMPNPCATNPCATNDPSQIRHPAGMYPAKGDRVGLLKECKKLWNDFSLSNNGL